MLDGSRQRLRASWTRFARLMSSSWYEFLHVRRVEGLHSSRGQIETAVRTEALVEVVDQKMSYAQVSYS
jgi:hypothetical protein